MRRDVRNERKESGMCGVHLSEKGFLSQSCVAHANGGDDDDDDDDGQWFTTAVVQNPIPCYLTTL